MSLDGLMVHDVVLVQPTYVVDRNRNRVADWGHPIRTRSKGWFEQVSALELIAAGRDAGVSTWQLTLPAGTAVDMSYRVEVAGDSYYLDGPPNVVRTPRGEHHREVRLKRVEG